MSVVVEFCQSNLSLGTDWVKDQLLLDTELDIEIVDYGCLGNCGECFLYPFALIGGEVILAETPEDLLAKAKAGIKRKMEEAEEWKKLDF